MFSKADVNFWATTRRRSLLGKFAVSLMLLLWIGLFAAAASPDLHRLLHKDSQNAAHQCLISQLQRQLIFEGFESPAVPAPVLVACPFPPVLSVQICLAPDHLLSPGRAPPSLLSSVTVAG